MPARLSVEVQGLLLPPAVAASAARKSRARRSLCFFFFFVCVCVCVWKESGKREVRAPSRSKALFYSACQFEARQGRKLHVFLKNLPAKAQASSGKAAGGTKGSKKAEGERCALPKEKGDPPAMMA